ncbi:hypothetical protein Ping_2560 [Psychromonas ingrahamii 37]|uniref:Uncharacterized protein n=1 Tax=Psychromonas ingrahamii (strain DSM 17664 / CCUG 51855 / 37) TaxID=357804 RepID=A1SXR6_PSYIN|nr:hypothetical protein [Psychromonas ingrahamii]ABM04281.1 hypothetical protein Ping_2560 [Psychromonas ingrahamii 37]
MKNILLKTCLTALALSVAGLANAGGTITDAQLRSYSAISKAAVNIAAQPELSTAPNVGGHLAAQAAVVIGANTTVNDIYAGAAVTTGAGSKVNQIKAGAAAGIGANATAGDVNAGAAVVVGAVANVGDIIAGAAITLGANATAYSTNDTVVTYGAGSTDNATGNDYIDQGFIKGPAEMTAAMMAITNKFHANPVDVNKVETYTGLSGLTIGVEGGETTEYYSAINLQANTTLTIEGNVTVITSGAITLGAGAEILLGNGANVTWILGGALNLGAGSKFRGETYVNGAVNGATSDVVCGNLYATGAISVSTIGDACLIPVAPATCPFWSVADLINVSPNFNSRNFTDYVMIVDLDADTRFEIIYDSGGNRGVVRSSPAGIRIERFSMDSVEYDVCESTLRDEINSRLP